MTYAWLDRVNKDLERQIHQTVLGSLFITFNTILGENVSAGSSVSEEEDEAQSNENISGKGDSDGVPKRVSRSSRSASALTTVSDDTKTK